MTLNDSAEISSAYIEYLGSVPAFISDFVRMCVCVCFKDQFLV